MPDQAHDDGEDREHGQGLSGWSEAITDFLDEHPRLAASAALAPRAARASRTSLATRRDRLRERAFFIVQCATSAALSWFIAGHIVGHEQPFFAPVATLVALGQSFGQRLQRVVEIVVGVAVGVLVGDIVVAIFGSGIWQLAAIIALAMSVATLLGAGVLMTTQAGVQAAFVTMIMAPPGGAFSRWIDAVIGGCVALAAATVTPTAPLRRPREYAASTVSELADILDDIVRAIRTGDLDLANDTLRRARRTDRALDKLSALADEGLAVVRSSPFRRGHLPAVQAIADLLVPLDRAARNIRVIARRGVIAVRWQEPIPTAYLHVLTDLAGVMRDMASTLAVRRLPEPSRRGLIEIGERTAYVADRLTLSSEVIRGQVRSVVVDLLMVTGLSSDQAVAMVPRSYSLAPGRPVSPDTPEG